MSRKNRGRNGSTSTIIEIGLSNSGNHQSASESDAVKTEPNAHGVSHGRHRTVRWVVGSIAIVLLVGLGVMASNSWLPKTDPLSGKKTGWFGKELPKNASSTWNPLAAPPPSPTPQLSKEYVYAGSRLLAVEDANANAAPPADLAVWRPSDGNWHVLGGTGSAAVTYNWGVGTDKVAQGDYDGDGKTDFAIYRPSASGQFYVVRSSDGSTTSYQIGSTNDLPAPGDYDGDGKTDYALYRPSDGSWYVVNSSTGILSYPYLGVTGTSAPADYDGDGKADAAVLNGSTFTARLTSNGQLQTVPIGSTGTPVSADYDGDGKANYSVRSGAGWIIANATLTPQSAITPSGDQSTDIPVQNDYDGDGKVDIAVWRPSTGVWYIRQSSNSQTRTEAFGMTGDIPVAAYYRR